MIDALHAYMAENKIFSHPELGFCKVEVSANMPDMSLTISLIPVTIEMTFEIVKS